MIKVDYISTKDINKVAKIHSNKKYYNWIMKFIDNEYRFYPPLVVENIDDEMDDFTFDKEVLSDEVKIEKIEPIVFEEEKIEAPMFGESWNATTKFFKEVKFNFVDCIEESTMNKKMRSIKKSSSNKILLEKFGVKQDNVVQEETEEKDSFEEKLEVIKDNCIKKLNEYKEMANSLQDNVEVLAFDN